MKNSSNGWQRPKWGLMDILLLPVAILLLPWVLVWLRLLDKRNEEIQRYAEKRRADLAK